MTKYWALDYVDEYECELIVDCQLYATEEEAYAARETKKRPERYDVTWYTQADLETDVFGAEVHIDENLVVHPYEW